MRDKGFFRFAEDFFEGADGEKAIRSLSQCRSPWVCFLPVLTS